MAKIHNQDLANEQRVLEQLEEAHRNCRTAARAAGAYSNLFESIQDIARSIEDVADKTSGEPHFFGNETIGMRR